MIYPEDMGASADADRATQASPGAAKASPPSGECPIARFTPGPWEAKRVEYELYGLDASYEVVAGRDVVAQTHMREIKSDISRLAADEANARLIAAAPELYEALAEFIAYLDKGEGFLSNQLEYAMRAALRKARGEA